MYKTMDSPEYVCVFHQKENKLAQIEASYSEGTEWYVNRLIVPPSLRNQGIATQLMKELTTWADKKKVDLLVGLHPSGDLGYQELKDFMEKHGFVGKDKEGEGLYKRMCVHI